MGTPKVYDDGHDWQGCRESCCDQLHAGATYAAIAWVTVGVAGLMLVGAALVYIGWNVRALLVIQ